MYVIKIAYKTNLSLSKTFHQTKHFCNYTLYIRYIYVINQIFTFYKSLTKSYLNIVDRKPFFLFLKNKNNTICNYELYLQELPLI